MRAIRSCSERCVRVWTATALAVSSGCVPGVPHFVTAAEARAGQPYADAEYGSAELTLQASPPPQPAPGPVTPDSVATASYWHWNGLGYERIPASREDSNPPYLWRWQNDPVR